LALPACAHYRSPPAEMATIVGCYRFTEADGAPGLPWGIELLPDSLTGWDAQADAVVARTWRTPGSAADHPVGYWKPLAADSIRTGYPAGGGIDLVLGRGDGVLSGRGRAVGDAVPVGGSFEPRPPHLVRAVRVGCPG